MARPPKPKTRKRTVVSAAVTEAEADRLIKEAMKKDMSLSQYLRVRLGLR